METVRHFPSYSMGWYVNKKGRVIDRTRRVLETPEERLERAVKAVLELELEQRARPLTRSQRRLLRKNGVI